MLIFDIPGLSHFLRYLSNEKVFSNIAILDIVVGVVLYFLVPPTKFPSGMTYTSLIPKVKKRFPTLPARLGVFLMHCPAPLIFTYNIFFFPNGQPYSYPALCYIIMTSYRAFIYPFFRNQYASPIPIKTIILYAVISANFGLNASIFLIFDRADTSYIGDIITTVLFAIFGILIMIHDWILCRSKNEKGYSINHINTLLWKWYTCPHYMLQLFQWCIWSHWIQSYANAFSYIILIIYLTVIRADAVFGMMCMMIQGYQFLGRKPCLPLLRDSKSIFRILLRF